MDSLFSFPVGLFHPLQRGGLSRRSPDGRQSTNWLGWGPRHFHAFHQKTGPIYKNGMHRYIVQSRASAWRDNSGIDA